MAEHMGTKQEELEAIVQQESYDVVPSQKHGGNTHMNGVWQWIVVSSSEGTGEEGVVWGESVP